LVIGAGAIGNELVKNLALLGIGNVFIADLDRVENSNLSRSVLYRESDIGLPKAEVAAARAKEIYPGIKASSFVGNIVYDLGLGAYRWADVILGGLDNREARVAINQAAARVGRIWIDGAIERLDGVARVFDPALGPCYECTMSETDWKMLEARRSCALLTRQEMEQGKVPTTPTTASVVAGIQCQEAVKHLHGLETLAGRGFVFEGTWHQSYVVNYTRRDDCPTHEAYEPILVKPWSVATTTVGELLEQARAEVGDGAIIELNHDVLQSLECSRCLTTEPMFASLGKITEQQGRCPKCHEQRVPHLFHSLAGHEGINDRTLAEIGVPPWDILSVRRGMRQVFFEFAGDRESVLSG
jgi:adenylyltransferase/sulfurtransferase